jgi:hypothetical protein
MKKEIYGHFGKPACPKAWLRKPSGFPLQVLAAKHKTSASLWAFHCNP